MIHEITQILHLSTMTLATVDTDHQPHAAAIYFAADEEGFSTALDQSFKTQQMPEKSLSIFFFSDPTSQHSLDLTENPQAAITIYPEVFDWEQIQGLQMRGAAKILPVGPLWNYGWTLYQHKFPFVSSLNMVVSENTLYCFTPHWLRWLNNRDKLGFKKEWQFQ